VGLIFISYYYHASFYVKSRMVRSLISFLRFSRVSFVNYSTTRSSITSTKAGAPFYDLSSYRSQSLQKTVSMPPKRKRSSIATVNGTADSLPPALTKYPSFHPAQQLNLKQRKGKPRSRAMSTRIRIIIEIFWMGSSF
jgi:hypothetical protein